MRITRCLLALALGGGMAWTEPSIRQVLLQRDQGGEPGAEVKYFKPSDRKQHFTVKLDQLKVGSLKVHFEFVGVDTSAGKNLPVQKLDVSALVGNEAHASVSLPRDWPYGSYKMDVSIDGKLARSVPYVVSKAPEELKVLKNFLLLDDGKGRAGGPVKEFSSKQHNLHFAVEVDGFLMGQNQVGWTFVADDTTAGKNVTIASVKKELKDFPGDTLEGNCELPRDWPTGKYHVEVTLNGRPLSRIPFQVKP